MSDGVPIQVQRGGAAAAEADPAREVVFLRQIHIIQQLKSGVDILMIHRFIKHLDNVAVLRCFVTDGDADHGFFLCGLRRRGQQGQSERQREQNDPWLVSDSLFSCDAPAGVRFPGGACVLLSCFCSIFYIDRRQLVNRSKAGEREKKGKKIQAAGGCLYFYLMI